MKNSILGKARWLRDVALATSKNNGARWSKLQTSYPQGNVRVTSGSFGLLASIGDVSVIVRKIAAAVLLFFTLGVGNAWGANATMTGGTNATASTFSGASGYKCGTGKAGGSMTVTIPANATVLSVYIAAWNGESPSVSITRSSGTISSSSVSPSGDSGISGSGTSYTLANTESTYLQTFTLSNVASQTTVTFSTSAKNKRFGVWGAKICYSPTSPTNTTIGSTTATLGWSDAKNVNSYEVYYSTTSTPPTASSSGTTTTSKSINLTSLTSSQQYYWWVRAYDDYCKTAWVAGTSFTTTSASCDKIVNITKGTPETGGSFTLDKTGNQDCCSALTVTVSNITAPSGKQFSAITQTGIAAANVTIDQNAKTVTYTANSNGSSTINVTFVDLPKYTVTLKDDDTELTQASYGASVTLPSRAGCSGYTFAGWSTTNNTSWTTTAPTIINAGSYTPTANIDFYPVYTKTESGEPSNTGIFATTSLGSTNTVTSGYEVAAAASAQSGYYQDGSGTTRSVSVRKSSTATAMISSTPTTATVTAKLGGGSAKDPLTNNVYAVWLDSNGDELGDPVLVTTKITTTTGSDFTANLPTANATSAYGVRIKHEKETSYNVRYYAISLSITTGGSTTYYISVPNCCTTLGTINGSVSLTQLASPDPTKLKATWTMTAETGIDSYDLEVYNNSDVLVKTINDYSSGDEITGLSPCTTYYVKLYTVSDGSPYCDGGLISTSSKTAADNNTTNGYTYTITKNNVSLKAGETEAATSCDDFMAEYVADGGYVLPVSISVSGASDYEWEDGVLMIDKTDVTGNVTVTINGSAAAYQFWYGPSNSGDGWTSTSFASVGNNEWQITNFVLPAYEWDGTKQLMWNVSGGSISATNREFYALSFAHTQSVCGDYNYYNDGTNKDAWIRGAGPGAKGTLRIYDNKADNGWCAFIPNEYVLQFGSSEVLFTNTSSAVWETAITDLSTLNSGTWTGSTNYRVGVGNASHAFVAVSNKCPATALSTMGYKTGSGENWGTGLNNIATAHGKFRIWIDNCSNNWNCHFVPYYHVTYNGNGASGSTAASADVSCEGTALERTVKAAANGFTVPTGTSFGGWATSADGAKVYDPNDDIELSANVELFAIWNDVDYTVTVNQNPAAGATTTGQTSTAHYNTTINLTTTVPEGYRFVNWTTSDGFSITNATSATTASFTMPNKNVTVTANFQQTHKVDWYVGGSAPANKIGNDGQTTVVDHGGKIEDFPATTPDGSACDKTFVGWTNTSSYVHGTSPLFNDVAGSPTINADANFYAVFATENVATGYTYIGDDGLLEEGETYIFISSKSTGSAYALKSSDLPNNNISGVKGTAVSVTVATGIKVTAENSDLEFTCTSHNATDKEDALQIGSTANTLRINGNGIGYGTARAYYDATGLWGWNNSVNKFYDVYYNSTSTKFEAKESAETRVYAYKKGGTTYSGHTITCSDCGTSVTPTFTAAPTGGTVAVTKGGNAVTSGSSVKTCTSQEFSVTLDPATHYTLTGFTASGLTTGTATISPTVGSVLPSTSVQTFTVTVSAGATGTLNLTPTFTAQTPLTITLSTNSKGTFDDPTEFPIYAGETFTFPDVTPNDPSCATFVGWIAGTTFVGDGTTHDAPVVITAGTVSAAQNADATYTAVFYETETTESDAYVKVTSTPADWANDHYLIVYEDAGNSYTNAVAFAGSRDNGDNGNIDATSNGIAVTIVGGNTIAATSSLAANEWRIAAVTGGYSIQSASGYYIGRAANSNGIDASNSTAYVNTIGYSDSRTNITSAGGKILKYNTAGDQLRFRYLTSAGDIQLYKLGTAVVETRTYTTNPSCTPKYRVTVASVTGGSPTAAPKFLPEGEEVTLTANPAAGYSFTGWTLTHTEGGAAASVTYTSGSASTETAVFEMPAYDVTVTATYAKIPVTSLQVKDGETVIPNSGTLNVSTGANKTLTVVITPADAYDHSWTATVTAGGTYASISNVADGSFRVNALAKGDATITVNAPNDGDAKTVTFTVHVTDILPEAIILKRDGSSAEIESLTMYYDAANTQGQYVKVNVSYTPTPTNKNFTFSSAATGKVSSHSHSDVNGYQVLVANGVTTDAVNCTFTSVADGNVTKVLAVTVLPILTDQFVDYIHGNATQSVSARLSADRYSIVTDINTPSLSDASDADPTSEDCETAHYHLIGWLPQATAEALMAAGTPITEATEGLVRAGVQVEATGQTWCAIWAEEAE